MASKRLKNKPKMRNPMGGLTALPQTPQLLGNSLTRVPVARCASRVFIFTGYTNFTYFDDCPLRAMRNSLLRARKLLLIPLARKMKILLTPSKEIYNFELFQREFFNPRPKECTIFSSPLKQVFKKI